jgi:hypothetical protein
VRYQVEKVEDVFGETQWVPVKKKEGTLPRPVTIKRTRLADELPMQEQIRKEVQAFCDRRSMRPEKDVQVHPSMIHYVRAKYGIEDKDDLTAHLRLSSQLHGDSTAFAFLTEKRIFELFSLSEPPEKENQEIFSSIDGEEKIEGRRVLFTLKSGVTTMNRSHANEMIETFPSIHRQTRSPIVIGLFYGENDRGNGHAESVVEKTGNYVHLLVGEPLYEYITGVRNARAQIDQLIKKTVADFFNQQPSLDFT